MSSGDHQDADTHGPSARRRSEPTTGGGSRRSRIAVQGALLLAGVPFILTMASSGCGSSGQTTEAVAPVDVTDVTGASLSGVPAPSTSSSASASAVPSASGSAGLESFASPSGLEPESVHVITDGLISTADGQECDVCANCVSNCGKPCCGPEPAPAGGGCGSPGQCACSVGGSSLVGYCASRPPSSVCTYCPPGTRSQDPCGQYCEVIDKDRAPPPTSKQCPKSHPVACGSASCCPRSHPACCGNGRCGATAADCEDEAPWYARQKSGSSSSGGSSSGGSSSGGGLVCSAQAAPNGCTLRFCTNTSASSCHYEVNGARVPCASCTAAGIQTCAQNAANRLIACTKR